MLGVGVIVLDEVIFVCLWQVCAANFGDICSVVGGEATEELLVRVDLFWFHSFSAN